MDKSRITAAIWPWGTETREQMEVAAQEVSNIGYECFESVKQAIYAFDLDLDAYREVLKRYNIKPVSFYYHIPKRGEEHTLFENLEKELEFVANLDVKRVCLQGTIGRPKVMDNSVMDSELEIITKFATIAKNFGITTNLHPHINTYVMYENEIEYCFENLPASLVSFAPDTAHLVAGKCDPCKVIEKYIDRVNFTHFKDIPANGTSSCGFAESGVELFLYSELGTGCVDFRRVFDLLKNAGYDGPLCAELDHPPMSNSISALNNYKFLVENY
ncbi:MAG: TIM barrel protein [Clostridia bacterium]|nr:TIM barrel protein [Clostridia bacterium]